jgi:alkylation response protein AidB-like acyl-CoA dehydrogenase
VTVQVHGAHGLTEQSDSQLFFRRAAVERAWLGSPRALRTEVLPLLIARHRAGRLASAAPPG